MKLFLDDTRPCPKGYRLARSAQEAIDLLRKYKVSVLALDYDLGWGQPKGIEVVRYLIRRNKYPRRIVIHSANPFGRERMFYELMSRKPANVKVEVRPLPWVFPQ